MSQPGDSNNIKHTKDSQSSGGDRRQTIDNSDLKDTSFIDRSSGSDVGDGRQTRKNEIDNSGVKNTSFVQRSSGSGDGGSGGGK
jgi:hypothetical protein